MRHLNIDVGTSILNAWVRHWSGKTWRQDQSQLSNCSPLCPGLFIKDVN